ncbi:FadR family transcriptional regulator [Nocardia sp. BSTN01]|uniref:FadR/GntR family transcriptional regulator n=1 Tax=Nocardia sp. BSTN01 TaxID=2783665 RepID=UPI00188FF780|nr:FCD domain-containing protein [Nocardia sp. BSTN01]MBF4997287.1 FadR family transcriptional regulator [Nocardia sp. BSTN01]
MTLTSEEFDSVRSRARAAQLARTIESDIADAGWPVGTVFGSEAELRERYGVSREVLREAVRLVEHHEVAVMRRGPAGGLVVTAPAVGPAIRAMAVYLDHVGATVSHVLDARLVLEPLAARLAAQNLTEQGLAALTAAESGWAYGEEKCTPELHRLLASLCGNPVLALFVDVLVALTGEAADCSRTGVDGGFAAAAIRDAVAAGEAGRAEYLVAAQLTGLRTAVRAGDQLGGETAVSTPFRQILGAGHDSKLAENIAHRLIEEIIDSRAPAGTLVGSEASLASRIDVSKAVLREALRIVEYHSVARMRLGPGGGLVVVDADPAPILETMAIYLDYEAVTAADVVTVRTALELACVAAAVERHREDTVTQELAATADVRQSEDVKVGKFAHDVHIELAELSGNPILALFLGIVRHLWSRHVDDPEFRESRYQESTVDEHRRIVAAIMAGNGPLARILMRDHIEHLPLNIHR